MIVLEKNGIISNYSFNFKVRFLVILIFELIINNKKIINFIFISILFLVINILYLI